MKDKAVLVSSAALGIGKACAAWFALQGAALVMVHRDDAEKVAGAIEETGGQAHAVSVDVSDKDSVGNLFAAAVGRGFQRNWTAVLFDGAL